MSIILNCLIVLLLIIFAIHFIGLVLSPKILKKIGPYNDTIYKNDHLLLAVSNRPDLMLEIKKDKTIHDDVYNDIDNGIDTNTHISLCIGGFYIKYSYVTYKIRYTSTDNHYGLYSIDGAWWWDTIWWKTKLYDNPFKPMKFIHHYIFNPKDVRLHDYKEYEKNIYNDNSNKSFPYIKTYTNVEYVNKHDAIQVIPKMNWYLEEYQYTLPILHMLKLDSLYVKRRIDLTFECENNGNKEFNGLGVIKNDWKGGVYGASVNLNNDSKFLYYYKTTLDRPIYYIELQNYINGRIKKFLRTDKIY